MKWEAGQRGWNARYLEKGDFWLRKPPREMLLDWTTLLPERGLALDAAAGVGTNGLFLAERGLDVIAMDISEVALRLALKRAQIDSLPFGAAVYDLALLQLPAYHFDVILNFCFLERANLQVYRRALKVGGVLFFETLLNTDAVTRPEYYLERGELLSAFPDYEILHWEEGVACGENRFCEQLIARRPRGLKI